MCCCPRTAVETEDGKTVHILLGVFFCLNFILSSGYPGMPFAFYHAGVLVSVFTLSLILFVGWNCAIWEVETMARAQAVFNYKEFLAQQQKYGQIPKEHPSVQIANEQSSALHSAPPQYKILSTRKFEPSELCEMFVGRWFKYVYLVFLSLYTFCSCPSYAAVAGSSWAVNLPFNYSNIIECTERDFNGHLFPTLDSCRNVYWLCLLMFACIVIPISLLELKKQILVQVAVGLLRFCVIGGMVIYCLVNLFMGRVIFDCANPILQPPSGNNWTNLVNSTETLQKVLTHFDWRGWVVSVPIFAFSFMLQQGIPSLTQPVRQKKYLRGYFNAVFLISGLLYMSVGVAVSLWFRGCVNETSTLNWDPTSEAGNKLPLRILSYYIILFPSFDVCLVFPLVVLAMVNNIYTSITGRDSSQKLDWKSFLIHRAMIVVVAICPIVIAMWVSNLAFILKFAGLFGLFVSVITPPILQLRSQQMCVKLFSATNNVVQEARIRNFTATGSSSSNSTALPVGWIAATSSTSEVTPLLHHGGSRQQAAVHVTPYSTIFSHLPCIIAIGFVAVCLMLVTVVGTFIHPT